MAGWRRHVVLGGFGVLTLLQSCTCHRETPPSEQPFSQRGGFSARFGTPRRDDAGAGELARRPLITAAQPTLPEAGETPTPGLVELPEDFPTDVPVFENAEAFATQKVASDGRTVLFRSEAPPGEIFDFYKDGLQKQGWNSAQEYQTKDQSFLSFQKGNMITNVTVAKDPRTGKQIIAVMYYEEQPLPFPEF